MSLFDNLLTDQERRDEIAAAHENTYCSRCKYYVEEVVKGYTHCLDSVDPKQTVQESLEEWGYDSCKFAQEEMKNKRNKLYGKTKIKL